MFYTSALSFCRQLEKWRSGLEKNDMNTGCQVTHLTAVKLDFHTDRLDFVSSASLMVILLCLAAVHVEGVFCLRGLHLSSVSCTGLIAGLVFLCPDSHM